MICGIQKKTQDDSSTSYGNGKLFQCKICQKSGKRADAVFCDLCRQYAHSSCCNFDLKNAVRLPSYNCRYCMRQAFGMFRKFLAFKKKEFTFLTEKLLRHANCGMKQTIEKHGQSTTHLSVIRMSTKVDKPIAR